MPKRRRRYDQFGFAGVDPSYAAVDGGGAGGYGGAAGFGFDDIGDIFESFFGGSGFGGFGGSTRTPQPQRPDQGGECGGYHSAVLYGGGQGLPQDHHHQAPGDLLRLRRLRRREGQHRRNLPRLPRHRPGHRPAAYAVRRHADGAHLAPAAAARARSSGIPAKNAAARAASGSPASWISISRAGIDNGQTFVVRGQGDQGVNNGPSGDVEVTVTGPPRSAVRAGRLQHLVRCAHHLHPGSARR